MDMRIPLILHQTYKDNNIPASLQGFQKSWRRHNPNWEYRFWDDLAIQSFFKQHYPTFLPVFEAYPHNIMRVDTFRYFLLYHYGGIYADMDFECLRPLDEILVSKDILLIPEPQLHFQKHKARVRNLDYIVSNALMASVPRHPFWQQVIKLLEGHKDELDILDATGPFMLTAAHIEFTPTIPIADGRCFGTVFSDEKDRRRVESEDVEKDAYAQHHWMGSWWKKNFILEWGISIVKLLREILREVLMPKLFFNFRIRAYLKQNPQPLPYTPPNLSNESQYPLSATATSAKMSADKVSDSECRALILDKGKVCRDEIINLAAATKQLPANDKLPLVSALLVTKDRHIAAMKSVECFLAQSYPNKELIIIDEGGYELQDKIRKLDSPLIFYQRNEKPTSLGKLRNRAVSLAHGEYVCQWDDDDLFHPQKINYQLAACLQYDADACFLLRELLLHDSTQRLAVSDNRLWEGTILAKKLMMTSYPHWARAEDYPAVHRLVGKRKVVALDLPELYIYNIHGNNTWHQKHMMQVWQNATKRYFLSRDVENKFMELKKDYPHL